jgi:hypothetical protein
LEARQPITREAQHPGDDGREVAFSLPMVSTFREWLGRMSEPDLKSGERRHALYETYRLWVNPSAPLLEVWESDRWKRDVDTGAVAPRIVRQAS